MQLHRQWDKGWSRTTSLWWHRCALFRCLLAAAAAAAVMTYRCLIHIEEPHLLAQTPAKLSLTPVAAPAAELILHMLQPPSVQAPASNPPITFLNFCSSSTKPRWHAGGPGRQRHPRLQNHDPGQREYCGAEQPGGCCSQWQPGCSHAGSGAAAVRPHGHRLQAEPAAPELYHLRSPQHRNQEQ